MNLLGIFHSHSDPSAALIIDGKVIAFVEEERLSRVKHAFGTFPVRAVRWVLEAGGIVLSDIDYITQAWDCGKYDDGLIAKRYEVINQHYPTTHADRAYQARHISQMSSKAQTALIERALRREFGNVKIPPVRFVNHHLAHAIPAFFCSGFEEALVVCLDGSGEDVTTSWWLGRGHKLELLREVNIPHSLGWVYSAFTEYLGFEAYDGEYKVMGLAAYGSANPTLEEKVAQLLWQDKGGGFATDPMKLSRGDRTWSYYYPDTLIEHFGHPPRSRAEPITDWHKDLALAVQNRLEEVVFSMAKYWTKETGVRRLCVSGGVGLNVKLNGNLFNSGIIDDLFAYPLCSDLGQSIGGALALSYELEGLIKERLTNLYFGPSFSD